MKDCCAHENEGLAGLRDAVETVKKSLLRSRQTLADIDAQLTWSHNRQAQQLSGHEVFRRAGEYAR
jgi:hypothetical protein